MSEGVIGQLLNQPRTELAELYLGQGETLCAVIDQARQPDALARLYGLGQPLDPISLFVGTEFNALAQQGPIWVSGINTPELKAVVTDLCLERNAGICVVTNDQQQALQHARWLLKVNDGSGGQSLLNYYRPSLWAALATTSRQNLSWLTGAWAYVLSPAPKKLGQSAARWIAWHVGDKAALAPAETCFTLPTETAQLQRQLGLVYWVAEHYAAFGAPSQSELRGLTDNLSILIDHHITQGRHLLRLSKIVAGSILEERPQIMAILQSQELPFKKVEQLELLGVEPLNSAANVKDEWSQYGTW